LHIVEKEGRRKQRCCLAVSKELLELLYNGGAVALRPGIGSCADKLSRLLV